MLYRLLALCIGGVILAPTLLFASVTASPLIIDRTVEARDMFSETITLTNDTALPVRLFASVNSITLDAGGAIESFVPPSMSDNTTSVTSWIAIDRGRLELPPGASTSLPISFKINPNAKPGLYHAFIGFGSGTNRDEAEAKVISGAATGVIVRISIADTRTEFLRLTRFNVDRLITGLGDNTLSYAVTNPGDVPLTPTGEVILYNTRGEEVGTVTLNAENRTIAPGETAEFKDSITPQGLFGKYKAFLNLEYGVGQKAMVYDTAFFYAAPLSYLAGLFGLLFVLSIAMVFWWRRSMVSYTESETGDHVAFYVRSGIQSDDQDHDIKLSKSTTPP
ncbi:DUF4832 domain-containing protein [Patescibacteria group bacterium]|nr:DUF4832 domain-containing protein [Patescibacteria group bacterium]